MKGSHGVTPSHRLVSFRRFWDVTTRVRRRKPRESYARPMRTNLTRRPLSSQNHASETARTLTTNRNL